jgi:hypothetical protein
MQALNCLQTISLARGPAGGPILRPMVTFDPGERQLVRRRLTNQLTFTNSPPNA